MLHSAVFSVFTALAIFAFALRLSGDAIKASLALLLFVLSGSLGWLVMLPEIVGSADPLGGRLWAFDLVKEQGYDWQNMFYGFLMPHRAIQTLIDAAVAILLTLLVTNKVLSPQYMIWLLPFAAPLRRQHAYLVVLATLLTLIIFPLNYDRLIALEPALIVTLNLRNSVLVLLLAMLLIGPFGRAHLARVWSAARSKHPGSPVPPASSDVSRAVVPGS